MVEPELPEDLKTCVAFHGHLCPGVVIGYCAAKLGMKKLSADRAGDEELIAIVENDSCAVDAVQVLTGCTFGKGNLFFRDHGKMVFTVAIRGSGRSVRLYLKPWPEKPADEPQIPPEQRRRARIEQMLASGPTELFDVRENALSRLPAAARIRESHPCDVCGEVVMMTRLKKLDGQPMCLPCRRERKRKGQTR